ncbi:diacylglycerol kinase family protein [Altibacter sp.]|uniref:diacylglycerol/lipid kinase family protein n=1 Tax=Altibacter sp. TaxID=2024823 RepID=UPI00258C6B4E|nr:diacylglycerol kinase family protein [Altibacter sp.]MCW9037654.1 diacylglycerol kinase family protein [Altibacter sp.]
MQLDSNILLIINPISGAIEKDGIVRTLNEAVKLQKLHIQSFVTSGQEDLVKLKKVLSKNEFQRIIVLGGDGTIKLAAEAITDQVIPLGILRGGSANGLANNLKIPTALDAQIEVALGDTIARLDRIRINDQFCLHISDLGINAELIKHYEASNIRGAFGYFLQSIPTLLSCDYPFEFEISLNGERFQKKGILLAIANAQKFGTGATINPKGAVNDGNFEVVIFKSLDIIEILKTLRDEVELPPEFAEYYSTTEARIRCKEPVPFQIDGEYQGSVTNIHATICDTPLSIAIPATT